MKHWGKHLILNIRGCNPSAIRCKATIENFSHSLVRRIDMIPYGPPQVVHFGEDDKAGYTLVQLISTSNITGHFVEAYDEIYLDVFSCKHFEERDVFDEVRKSFQPDTIESHTLLR